MRRVWWVAAFLVIAGSAGGAVADYDEVDCSTLERIRLGDPGSYDEVYCYSVGRSGLSSSGGERRAPVGGTTELIVAVNRATFVLVRFDGTNNRTYLQLDSVSEALGNALDWLEPRNWGEAHRHDRFSLAAVEAKVSEDSPHLSCIGFLARLRPVAGAAGYREAVGGLYCAMDRLDPTDDEVAAFLAGLTF